VGLRSVRGRPHGYQPRRAHPVIVCPLRAAGAADHHRARSARRRLAPAVPCGHLGRPYWQAAAPDPQAHHEDREEWLVPDPDNLTPAAVADNTRRLDAAGDSGAALALAVVDPAGATVMCVWAGPGGNTRYRFPDPHNPQLGGFGPGSSQPG